ncbi:hypothetical protein COCOBI_15-2590 [Coccomyxa sp. Obi]|nr:hypothetical protein COCOBI_15-2590 [Coccomyxa sp. Obi]
MRCTLAPNNGAETRRPLSHVVEEFRSSSRSDASAATQDDDASKLYQTEGQQNGGEGFTGPLAQDVSSDSDSDSDSESDSDEEELFNLGDGDWIHKSYLEKPREFDIVLFCHGEPDQFLWMAIAPEWNSALGFGSTKKEASEDLQSQLLDIKLIMMATKNVDYIKTIPLRPCMKNAEKECARGGWFSYYEKLEKDCYAWGWGTIRV